MKTVVICGSARFAAGIREFARKLKESGVYVYEPHLYRAADGKRGNWDHLEEYDKKLVATGLTHDHFYKMRMADVIFVYNQDGYIGVSTTLEIGFAVALDKPIFTLSSVDEEICRHVLFREAVATPEEFVKLLEKL